MAGKPSFLRDPDQAAELAALLRDTAGDLDNDLAANRDDMTRRQVTQEETTIRRYRAWADELDAPAEAPAPVQIRPATRHTEQHTEGATG
jgi:hypothetical protein